MRSTPHILLAFPAAGFRLVALLPYLALMGCSAGGGAFPARPFVDANAPPAGLAIARKHLDFGETWENPRFEWTLPIENRREQDVRIRDFTFSCTCLSTEPRSLVIPAGETRDVKLTLDLVDREVKGRPQEGRDFKVTIWPRLDGESSRSGSWTIAGRVRTAIYFDKPVLDLGRHSELAQPLPLQKVKVMSLIPLKGIMSKTDSQVLEVSTSAVPADPCRFELVVSPKKLPVGQVGLEVVIVPQLSDGQELPGIPLKISGWLVSDFQASPPAVVLGSRQIGELAEERVSLYSLTGRSFDITDVSVNGEGLAAGLLLTQEPTYLLKQEILKQGHQRTRVLFRLKTANGNADVEVPVSYLGLRTLGQ